jgi:hypothetical protein
MDLPSIRWSAPGWKANPGHLPDLEMELRAEEDALKKETPPANGMLVCYIEEQILKNNEKMLDNYSFGNLSYITL